MMRNDLCPLLPSKKHAVRYTGPGGNVAVSLNKNGNKACVAVIDTGTCIPQENLPHIFERFYRVHKTDSSSPSGSGLGLAISRSIAELHHGTIEVESEVGKGSTFMVLLPLSGWGSSVEYLIFLNNKSQKKRFREDNDKLSGEGLTIMNHLI